tara:strand:- start:17 stop:340 length:324 start_codon:yes stop_codon:yes gene_type:complete
MTIETVEKKIAAIKTLKPDAEWNWSGSTGAYSELTWIDSKQTKPTESEIDAEISRVNTEFTNKTYARVRKSQYPDIGDQLDDLYKQGAFSAEMAAKLKKVKDDNPKP